MSAAEFRQWAMIYAMQGLLANPLLSLFSVKTLADNAVRSADALLAANTIDEPEPNSDAQ